jgi:hypothetical protein
MEPESYHARTVSSNCETLSRSYAFFQSRLDLDQFNPLCWTLNKETPNAEYLFIPYLNCRVAFTEKIDLGKSVMLVRAGDDWFIESLSAPKPVDAILSPSASLPPVETQKNGHPEMPASILLDDELEFLDQYNQLAEEHGWVVCGVDYGNRTQPEIRKALDILAYKGGTVAGYFRWLPVAIKDLGKKSKNPGKVFINHPCRMQLVQAYLRSYYHEDDCYRQREAAKAKHAEAQLAKKEERKAYVFDRINELTVLKGKPFVIEQTPEFFRVAKGYILSQLPKEDFDSEYRTQVSALKSETIAKAG